MRQPGSFWVLAPMFALAPRPETQCMVNTQTAEARPLGRLAYEVEVGGHGLIVDANRAPGRGGLGPTPKELIAAALAACAGSTMRMYAERKGWDVKDAHVIVEPRPGQSASGGDFEVTLRLPDELSDEQVRRLQVIASKCPVRRMLSGERPPSITERVERI
jgi:putative redox protein